MSEVNGKLRGPIHLPSGDVRFEPGHHRRGPGMGRSGLLGLFWEVLGRGTGPRGEEMAGGFTGTDSQDLATILEPFRFIFDDLGPDGLSETSTSVLSQQQTSVLSQQQTSVLSQQQTSVLSQQQC